MEIIIRISKRINSKLKSFDFSTDSAVKEAVALMNEPLSEQEKRDIAAFSKQLEPAICPDFKTIHDQTTTSDLWTIAHWIIRSHLLVNHLMETTYQHSKISDYELKTEYTEEGWMIVLLHNRQTLVTQKLHHFYGLPLIKEIMNFIIQKMPE